MKKYSAERASEFWSNRLKSTDPLAAILICNSPKVFNGVDDQLGKESVESAFLREDGYFVTLVGIDWLKQVCDSHRIKLRVKVINPMCSLVHDYATPSRKRHFGAVINFDKFCLNARKFYSLKALNSPGLETLASYFMDQII